MNKKNRIKFSKDLATVELTIFVKSLTKKFRFTEQTLLASLTFFLQKFCKKCLLSKPDLYLNSSCLLTSESTKNLISVKYEKYRRLYRIYANSEFLIPERIIVTFKSPHNLTAGPFYLPLEKNHKSKFPQMKPSTRM